MFKNKYYKLLPKFYQLSSLLVIKPTFYLGHP